MVLTIYYLEDDNFYFVWKPAGIATSFGLQKSFLDEILEQKPTFFLALQERFGKEEEFGLLNRLDNDTQWFLYFAKTPEIKSRYKNWQDEKKLVKQYLCDVRGNVDVQKTVEKTKGTSLEIWGLPSIKLTNLFSHLVQKYPDFEAIWKNTELWIFLVWLNCSDIDNVEMLDIFLPIMHSASSADRMIAVSNQKDFDRGRWKSHNCETFLFPLAYDETKNSTRCVVFIQQGIRHQIRTHLATIGYPIVGDALYNRSQASAEKNDFLHLWSVWFGYPGK